MAITPVHPHVCGERSSFFFANSIPTGSSPRVWGTSRTARMIFVAWRFIPTCVGNVGGTMTSAQMLRFIPTCVGNVPPLDVLATTPKVHPHVCGERMVEI